MSQKSPVIVTGGMFLAMIAAMTSFVSFPALLPTFQAEWDLSASTAGWISGIFFAGYVATVPILSAMTDRIDPRRIFLFGMALTALATLGFGFMATDAVSASFWRLIQGIGFASCYMPGLKAVSDAVPDGVRDRSAAFYTGTFTVGVAFSYLLTGQLAQWFDWRTAFAFLALGPLLGALLAMLVLPSQATASSKRAPVSFNVRQVISNKKALSYMVAYGIHNAESSIMRAWTIAFLVFAQASIASRTGEAPAGDPTVIAGLVSLGGLPAILIANEVARRFGRQYTIIAIMIASSLMGVALAGAAAGPFIVIICLFAVYGVLVPADSGSINAGLLEVSDPSLRGGILGLHAVIGFGGAFLGPILFGLVLDFGGGATNFDAWIVAFSCVAALAGAGSLLLWRTA